MPSGDPSKAPVRLLRIGRPVGTGQRAVPNRAYEIARGGLDALLQIVRGDDGELWRYTIVLPDDRHVRNEELRTLIRSSSELF